MLFLNTLGRASPSPRSLTKLCHRSIRQSAPSHRSSGQLGQHLCCTARSSCRSASTSAEGRRRAASELSHALAPDKEDKEKKQPVQTVAGLVTTEMVEPGDVVDVRTLAPTFKLRPYQEAAISACTTALDEGVLRMGVSSPTGSGKTTMFMKLIPEVVEREGRQKQALIIVSSVELASQSVNAAERLLGDEWSVEMEQGKSQGSGAADVTVATYQTLIRPGRMDKYDPANYGLVIVDEAHHAAARSYLRVLQHFNRDVNLPQDVEPIVSLDHEHRVPIVGFSATFSRPDQLALNAVFEKIVFHREISTMLSEGWLSPARLTTVETKLDLGKVRLSKSGDFNLAELSEKMDKPENNQLIVRTYLHIARERRATLIFCVDLTHVDSLVDTFRNAGVDARSVSSMSKPVARRNTLAAFVAGEFPVLINCEVLTEGADIPTIDCVILARPCRSRNLLAQMVGRGLRLSPETGKTDCHIIDLVDSASRGLTVSPSLLGLSYEDLDALKEAKEDLEEEQNRTDEEALNTVGETPLKEEQKRYKVHFVNEGDPFSLEDKKTKYKLVNLMSPYAWVACGGGRYVLDLLKNREYLRIEPSEEGGEQDGLWSITRHYPPPPFWKVKVPGMLLQKVIAHSEDLERAFAVANAYILHKVGFEGAQSLLRSAPWRMTRASEKQIQLLADKKGVILLPQNDSIGQPRSLMMLNKVIPVSAVTKGIVQAYLIGLYRGAFTKRRDVDGKKEKAKGRATERKKREELRARGGLELPEEV